MADLLYPLKKPVAVPLPSAKEHEKFFISVPNALSAYHVCLELEQHAMELAKTNTPSESTNRSHPDDPLICARVLGYLLIYAPTSHALAEVVKVIHSCSRGSEADRYSKLLELGASFQNWFIRACRLLIHCPIDWRSNYDQSGNSKEGLLSYRTTRAAHHLMSTGRIY